MRVRTVVAVVVATALAACSKSNDQRGGPPPRSGGPAAGTPATVGDQASADAQPGGAEAARVQRNAEIEAQQAQQQQRQGTAQAHEVSGRVVTANERELVLAREDGVKPDLRLRIGPGATITVAGRTARAADLTEGTPVRAAYQLPDASSGDEPTAIRIVARPEGTATGAPHGAAGAGGGGAGNGSQTSAQGGGAEGGDRR